MQIEEFRSAVSTKTAAHVLGCGSSRVRKLVNSGDLEGFKDGTATRVYKDSIERYQQRNSIGKSQNSSDRTAGVAQVRGFQSAIVNLKKRGLIRDFEL